MVALQSVKRFQRNLKTKYLPDDPAGDVVELGGVPSAETVDQHWRYTVSGRYLLT